MHHVIISSGLFSIISSLLKLIMFKFSNFNAIDGYILIHGPTIKDALIIISFNLFTHLMFALIGGYTQIKLTKSAK